MKKNNILWYSHESGSHNHWKFKLLRKQYGWAGEGKFWALNNIIAHSDNCLLDITHNGKVEQIAADLDFDVGEFLDYMNYLIEKCKLVKKEGEFYTTGQVQDDLKKFMRNRENDRLRKLGINK